MLSIVCDMLASTIFFDNNLTRLQFKVLLALAIGTMPQIALFALVIAPATMGGKCKEHSLIKALALMEGFAIIVIVMLAVALIGIMHYRETLLNAFSHY